MIHTLHQGVNGYNHLLGLIFVTSAPTLQNRPFQASPTIKNRPKNIPLDNPKKKEYIRAVRAPETETNNMLRPQGPTQRSPRGSNLALTGLPNSVARFGAGDAGLVPTALRPGARM